MKHLASNETVIETVSPWLSGTVLRPGFRVDHVVAANLPLTDLLIYFSRKHPDLASVVDAWPGLPETVRVRIVGIVKETTIA